MNILDFVFIRSRCAPCFVLVAAGLMGHALPAAAQSSRAPTIVAVCEPCHGADGTTGNIETPNLAGPKGIYLRQQLLAFRDGRRKHPDMKTISRNRTEREINQLVLYYSTLSSP